jgi:RimJ/RimL family protein N-acetyltransferase
MSLRNGTPILIREVTHHDRQLLQTGFDHMSDRSKYFRFLAARKTLMGSELDKFTATNNVDHVAVGALVEGATTPEPIGIARYIRIPDRHHAAEIAIAIVDDYQHQGLGSALLGVLAKFASLNGISEFDALVHTRNSSMQRLLKQLDSTQTLLGGSEIEIRISVFPDPAQYPQSSVGDAIRDVFELSAIA